MSIFGNTGTNTGTTGTSLFGNPSTTQPTTSLFGNTAQQGTSTTTPATGGGLFGNTQSSTTQPTTSLFGGATNTNTQKPAGSLFGATTTTGTTPATGTSTGGLFGNTASSTQAQPATGGLFGSTTTNTQQPAASGGLFGNAASTTQPPAGGGLFGSTANTTSQPAAGGLFGSTTNAPAQPAAGGLFGSTANTAAQPPATGGLFGSTAQPATTGITGTTGGLFGSTTTGQTSAPTTSAFGQPAAGSGTGGLFGSTTAQPGGSLFGSAAPKLGVNTNTTGATSTNPLFGGQTQQSSATGLGSSMLSSTALTAPSKSLLSSIQPQPQDPQGQHLMFMQKIETIFSSWNPSSPQCRFRHVFYNMVNPNQTAMYSKPPNMPDDLWAKAAKENPDPKRLVPVMASSFDDLRERVNGQAAQAEKHQQYIDELKKRIDTLQERHGTTNTARLKRLTSQQTQLQHRLIAFIQHLHLLIPAVRSSAIKPEEEQLRSQLEEIEEEVMKRGRVRGKLNELWALIGAVGAAQERGAGGRRGGDGAGGWAVVDEEGLAQIAQILSEQQSGLAHLTKVLQQDLKDLDVIMGRSSRAGEET